MNQLTHHAHGTVRVGSVFALVLCTMWLLDATAQDQRKPIPDQPAVKKPVVTASTSLARISGSS